MIISIDISLLAQIISLLLGLWRELIYSFKYFPECFIDRKYSMTLVLYFLKYYSFISGY